MGYTHYWYIGKGVKTIPDETFANVKREILNAYDLGIVQFESDQNKPPIVRPDFLRFNGVGELGHETFWFNLNARNGKFYYTEPGKRFDFCKTARKPYDLLVTIVLCLLKDGLGDKVRVSSDGSLYEEGVHTTTYEDAEWHITRDHMLWTYKIDIAFADGGLVTTRLPLPVPS